jgi:phosphatidate cytidylyltransferase
MRNFLTRTASAIVFAALFLAGLLWHPIAFGVIFSFVIAVMSFEYLRITLGKREIVAQVISVFTNLLLFALFFLMEGYGLNPKWLLTLPVLISLIILSALYCKDENGYKFLPFALTSIIYISLPFALTNFIVFGSNGEFNGLILLCIMIIIWASDVGAYLFGIAFGQKNGHKLFPSISPKKSWEGYWGGLLLSLAAGYALYALNFIQYELIHVIIISLIINVTSTFGDLAESQLKRNFGVKDSGKIMPGHGGLLDRFDGALFAFPATVAYIIITTI